MEDLEKLCKYATSVNQRRGEIILCTKKCGKTYPYPLLGKGEVCVATDLVNLGHSDPDVFTDLDEIEGCKYREV